MGVKSEITWKTRTPEGERREVNVRRSGGEWKFYIRDRRFERWEPLEEPSMEDWLELLDGVRRRIARQLLRPEEEGRVQRSIRERFPDVEV